MSLLEILLASIVVKFIFLYSLVIHHDGYLLLFKLIHVIFFTLTLTNTLQKVWLFVPRFSLLRQRGRLWYTFSFSWIFYCILFDFTRLQIGMHLFYPKSMFSC